MVEIFGYKLFGCSECNKTKRHSRRMKRKRSYRGGYKYKLSSSNNAGEDVSNLHSSSSRSRSYSASGKGKGATRRRRH